MAKKVYWNEGGFNDNIVKAGNFPYLPMKLDTTIDDGKPLLLIFNTINERAPLITKFLYYLKDKRKRFNVVIETHPYATVEQVVNQRLRGKVPDYVMAGNTLSWGFASSHEYMKQNGIKFIYMIGDLENAMNNKFDCYLWENMKVDYVTVNFGYHGWSNEGMLLEFLDSHDNLRDAKVFYSGLPINPNDYPNNKLERPIDVAYLSTVGENFQFHKLRKKIRRLVNDMLDLNVLVTNVYDDEYVSVLNKTKILIVDGSMRGALTQKYLESTSCGCFLLGDVPDSNNVFVDGVTMARVSDWDNLDKEVYRWLAHAKERDFIQKRCSDKMFSSHHINVCSIKFEEAILGVSNRTIQEKYNLPVDNEYVPETVEPVTKPVILVLLNNLRFYENNCYDTSLPDKAPLATDYYRYVGEHSKEFQVVIERDPLVSIPEIVEKRLGGVSPACVIKSYGYQYGLLSHESNTYMEKNKVPLYVLMGDISAFCFNRYHSDMFEYCDVNGIVFPFSKRSICYPQLQEFINNTHNLTDPEILLRESLIDTEKYAPAKPDARPIDVSLIMSGTSGERTMIRHKLIEFQQRHPDIIVNICNVFGDDYLTALQQSKIFIVHVPTDIEGITYKYLEGGACGALLMGTVPKTDNRGIFVDGKTMVELDFNTDIEDKLLRYLNNDKERKLISKRCRKEIIKSVGLKNHAFTFVKTLKKSLKRFGRK